MKCPTCESEEIYELQEWTPIELYAYECKDCNSLFERKQVSHA